MLRLDSWYIEHWLTGVQVPMVNEDNGRSGLATESMMDDPETVEIMTWFKSMYDDGLLKAVPYSNPFDQLFAMALQTSSMLIDTSTAITTVNCAIEGTLNNDDIGAEDLRLRPVDVLVRHAVRSASDSTPASRGGRGPDRWRRLVHHRLPATTPASPRRGTS